MLPLESMLMSVVHVTPKVMLACLGPLLTPEVMLMSVSHFATKGHIGVLDPAEARSHVDIHGL